ncbi:MAG TPA: hypothetical protein VL961_02000 [Acidimicrobiales bacterium]|nr:hypothetical protein [Acidimicrobiales bacterium]
MADLASALYEYVPHHRTRHRLEGTGRGPVKVVDQLPSGTVFQRLNSKIGLRITVVVGTMWCAYVFAAIALVSLKDNIHSTQDLILWISSSFLQLVLLPVIIVGQNIQAKAADARAEATFNDADAVLHEAVKIQDHLLAQDAVLKDLVDRLDRVEGRPA